ncbi:hypothetical protein LEMLEM_LOCUS21216, partial [Lemmus lemmus]
EALPALLSRSPKTQNVTCPAEKGTFIIIRLYPALHYQLKAHGRSAQSLLEHMPITKYIYQDNDTDRLFPSFLTKMDDGLHLTEISGTIYQHIWKKHGKKTFLLDRDLPPCLGG